MSCTKKEKSLLIFESFLSYDDVGNVDVSPLFTKKCFNYWLSSRANKPKNPPEAFRKALTSHCAGVDGRKPFAPEVERALLVQLRMKRVWECFRDTKSRVGLRGLQIKGFWERTSTDFALEDLEKPVKKKRKRITRSSRTKTEIKLEKSLDDDHKALLAFANSNCIYSRYLPTQTRTLAQGQAQVVTAVPGWNSNIKFEDPFDALLAEMNF